MQRESTQRVRWAGNRVFWIGVGVLVAFKLWLVASDEVVARFSPYDQQRYAEMAREIAAGRWLGAYDHFTLVREATYPLWMVAVRAVGVPLRIASEVLLAVAALAVGLALRRRGLSALPALAVFACAWLAPHSLLVNREILAESLYLPTLLLGVSALWCAVDARRTPARVLAACAAGLALGVAWTTRPEKPVLLLALFVFAVLEIAALRAAGLPVRRALARIAGIAAIVALGIAAVGAANAARNGRAYGLRVASDLAGPGFLAAQRELNGLPHPSPRRFVLVPREVRLTAYAASPSLAALAAAIERPGWPQSVSCNSLGICDDLAGSWFLWALREAVMQTQHPRDAAQADAYFQRIADELGAARARGELPPLRATLPLLHPYPSTYLAYLGDALARVVARIADAGGPGDWSPSRDDPVTPPSIRRLFDDVASRRTQLTSNGEVVIEGRIEASVDPVVAILLRPDPGPRAPKVEPEWSGEATAAGRAFRFHLEKQRPVFLESRPLLELRRASGAMLRIPVSPTGLSPAAGGADVHIDRIEETDLQEGLRTGIRRWLWLGHALWVRAAALAGGAALLVLAAPPWRGRRPNALLAAAGVLLTLCVARVALLALVTASTWRAYSVRYVYPAVSPFTIGAILLGVLAVRRLRGNAPRLASSDVREGAF